MPTPTPHMNGAHRSKLPVFQTSTSSSSPANLKRANDELRQHIARLKVELEVEKAKSKQIHRDKVADIKKLKDDYDREKLLVQGSVSDKLKAENDVEMTKMKESLQREKEIEIKQILKFKDEELRTTKKMMAEDKDFSLKELEERLKREFSGKNRDSTNETENKLKLEMNDVKKQRQHFEELYKQKAAADSEKGELLRKLKEDHERENQRVLRDARIQIARNVHELKTAQKALADKEQEMTKREIELTLLEEEKEQLLGKVKSDSKQNGEVSENAAVKAERDWELQLKNMELKKTVDELTRKVTLLEKELNGRKSDLKDGELSARSEQRVKELRKRNGELVNLARKLEEKAKRLQEELKEAKSKDAKPVSSGNQSLVSFENFKKTYTMQRARDLAEHAKVSMAKDKEIVALKKKIAGLEEELHNSSEDPMEIEKLELAIRQIEKEKLRLEKQLADRNLNQKTFDNNEKEERLKEKLSNVELERRELQELVLEQKNSIEKLRKQVETHADERKRFDDVEASLREKENQCNILVNDLNCKKEELEALEDCISDLKRENGKIESENEKQKLAIDALQSKLNEQSIRIAELESLEREYKALQGRLSEAESQCTSMQDQLDGFQEKVKYLKSIEEELKESEVVCKKWERDYDYAVDQINNRNKEIRELHEVQRSMKDRYNEETDTLKAEITRLEDICVDLEAKEVEYTALMGQQDRLNSLRNTPVKHVYVQTSRPHTPVKEQQDSTLEEHVAGLDEFEETEKIPAGLLKNEISKQKENLLLESESDFSLKNDDDDILNIASSRIAALAAVSSSDGDFSREEEFPSEKIFPEDKAIEAECINGQSKENAKGIAQPFESGDTSDELSLSLDEMSENEEEDQGLKKNDVRKKHLKDKNGEEMAVKKRSLFKEKQDSEGSVFNLVTPLASFDNSVAANENITDSNTVQPGVEKLSVFVAKYTYDPLEHSPNDEPSLELALEAGDYVYIFGDADEDGFYTGELVNGDRGLVPSNFVEKIADESDLVSFSNGLEDYPGSESDDDLTEAEYLKVTPRPKSIHSNENIFNDDTDEESLDELQKKGLSPPRNLKVERQLKNSVVISWLPPDGGEADHVKGYSIKVDGKLKETVIGSSKTKAFVSDINCEKVCRITVQSFDQEEKEAEGTAAAITVGRGASAVPSDLRILHLAPTCADLEWSCGNTSMLHAIFLNGNEIHIVKPGIDQFKLTNLSPDHEYEVNVEARAPANAHKRPKNFDSRSNELIFRTPKPDPPDPPLNVQVRISKRSVSRKQTSVQVSWLPVTIADTGTSSRAIISGYKICMNDKEVVCIDEPTLDYAEIVADDLKEILNDSKIEFIELCMKTISSYGESAISNVVVLSVAEVLCKPAGQSWKERTQESVIQSGIDEGEDIENVSDTISKYDLIKKDSDAERKLDLINELAAEEERLGTVEAKSLGMNIMKEEKEAVEDRKEASKTEKSHGKKSKEKEILQEAVKKKQGRVIRYDVVDSDDSDDGDDEDDSDDEVHVFNVMDTGSGNKNDINQEVEKSSKTANDSVPQNLILPSIPVPDYLASESGSNEVPPRDYPNAVQVKHSKHFPLNELLSTSDSELSAIEEETVEDLLEYNKDGSCRPASKSDNAGQSADSLTKGNMLDVGQPSDNVNKTFSIHSEEEQEEKTYSLNGNHQRRSPDKVSERKSGRGSKDSLTFSSDDVMDLLDKDIVGGVPDLPLDECRESVAGNRTEVKAEVDDGQKECVPVTNLSDLSFDRETKERETQEKLTGMNEKIENVVDRVDNHTAGGVSVKERDRSNVVDCNDPPAKQTPVRSNDQENIDANKEELSEQDSFAYGLQLTKKASFAIPEPDDERSTKRGNEREVENIVLEERGIGNEAEADSRPLTDDIEKDKGSNRTVLQLLSSVSEEEPMGDSVSLAQNESVEFDEDDEKAIKVPQTAVHDLYTLNKVDSFEDSEAELQSEFNPYFMPPAFEKNAEPANSETEDEELGSKNGAPIDEPSMEKRTHAERSTRANTGSIEESSALLQDQAANNAGETSMKDTRQSHVVKETKPNNVRVFVALFSYDPVTMSPNIDDVDEELAFSEGDLIKVFGECDDDGFYYGELGDLCGLVPSNMVQEVSLGDFGNSFNIPPPTEDISAEENIQPDIQSESRDQSQSEPAVARQEQRAFEIHNPSTNQEARGKPGGTAKDLDAGRKKIITTSMDDMIRGVGDIDLDDVNPDYRYISERDSIYCLPPMRMIALYDYDPAVSSPNVDSEVELAFNKGEIIFVFGSMDEDGFFAAQCRNERGLVPSNFLEECPELSDSEEIEINMGAASPSIQTSSGKSSSIGASPVDSPKTKKKKGILAKGKKIFSKLKGK